MARLTAKQAAKGQVGPLREDYWGPEARNALSPYLRRKMLRQGGRLPFPDQAILWLSLEGYLLSDFVVQTWDSLEEYAQDPGAWGWEIGRAQDCMEPDETITRRLVEERPEGPAEASFILAAYKFGKSQGGSDFVGPQLMLPGVEWDMIGEEYDTVYPEMKYIGVNLVSRRGFDLPMDPPGKGGDSRLYVERFSNSPDTGRVVMRLSNGAICRARSWQRAGTLKGKEVDGYLLCELFQLPGLRAYTDFKQNLTARSGKAFGLTTPDEPWLKTLVELGEDPTYPEYFCKQGVARKANPFTYNRREYVQDKGVMTSEQHAVAHEGRIAEYIGSVYKYERGTRLFTTKSHPHLWKNQDAGSRPENLDLPPNWRVAAGGDTGTLSSWVIVAFSDHDPVQAYVLSEAPNYKYVGTEVEGPIMSIFEWYQLVKEECRFYGCRQEAWADFNSQFKEDASFNGITLVPGFRKLQLRTERTRALFQHDRIFFAPWLTVLPREVEIAKWPEDDTSERLKVNDHSLDALEHVCSQRLAGKVVERPKHSRIRERILRERGVDPSKAANPYGRVEPRNPWA